MTANLEASPARSGKLPIAAAGAGCGTIRRLHNSPVWYGLKGKNMTQVDMVAVDELVREIARALVDDPAAVEVETVAREENTVLRLRVAPQDVGKVIGKQGRTARSMRTILSAVSMKLHHRYTLDILEEDEGQA